MAFNFGAMKGMISKFHSSKMNTKLREIGHKIGEATDPELRRRAKKKFNIKSFQERLGIDVGSDSKEE